MATHPASGGGERERRQGMLDLAIGATGTALLVAVFTLWPLAGPAMAAATWLHQTIECAVAGECEALADRNS